MRTYWGSRSRATQILNLGTKWSFTLWLLYPPGEGSPVPTGEEAGWA